MTTEQLESAISLAMEAQDPVYSTQMTHSEVAQLSKLAASVAMQEIEKDIPVSELRSLLDEWAAKYGLRETGDKNSDLMVRTAKALRHSEGKEIE